MELIGGSILVVMLTIKLDTQVTIGVNEQKPCEVAKSMTNGWPGRVPHPATQQSCQHHDEQIIIHTRPIDILFSTMKWPK